MSIKSTNLEALGFTLAFIYSHYWKINHYSSFSHCLSFANTLKRIIRNALKLTFILSLSIFSYHSITC